RDAADGAALLVFLPAGTDDVATHDGLHGDWLEALGDDCAAFDQRQFGGRYHVLDLVTGEVVGHHAGELVEPEVGNGSEDLALLWNRLLENDIECRQTIGRHHQHALVVDFVEVADLARVDLLQAQGGGCAHVGISVSGKQNRRNLCGFRPSTNGCNAAQAVSQRPEGAAQPRLSWIRLSTRRDTSAGATVLRSFSTVTCTPSPTGVRRT